MRLSLRYSGVMTTILLTGSSRGIGAAAKASLEARGAKVIGQATSSKAVDTVPADFCEPGAPHELWEAALARTGGEIDVLINNAGLFDPNPLDRSDIEWLDAWEDTMRINLTAAAQLSHGADLFPDISPQSVHRGNHDDITAAQAPEQAGQSVLPRLEGLGRRMAKVLDGNTEPRQRVALAHHRRHPLAGDHDTDQARVGGARSPPRAVGALRGEARRTLRRLVRAGGCRNGPAVIVSHGGLHGYCA